MQVFDLIKKVLDLEYDAVQPAATRDDTVKAALAGLSESYKDLIGGDRSAPDYSEPATRFAYIYKYTTCHANLVANVIGAVPELRDKFKVDGWVHVAAIGGGPGSDFLGVIKHMISRGRSANLKCYLLDCEAGWGDTWADVDQQTEDLDFRISTHSQVLDVLDSGTWESQTRYLKSDVFLFTYFISEVYRLREEAEPFFAHLFENAKPDSVFLFIDNDRSAFYDWFDEMAKNAGLELKGGESEFYQLISGEEKKSLEPYLTNFAHTPKLGTKIAWRAYRKP